MITSQSPFPIYICFSVITGLNLPANRVGNIIDGDKQNQILIAGSILRLHDKLPFDCLYPNWAPSREERDSLQVIHNSKGIFLQNKKDGSFIRLSNNLHHYKKRGLPNEDQKVFNREDVDSEVVITPTKKLINEGRLDYIKQAAELLGKNCFIIVVVSGTFPRLGDYLGLTNLFKLLYKAPQLVEYLSRKLVKRQEEKIKALAWAGVDAVYLEDYFTTSDVLSVEFFQRFSLPFMKQLVKIAHQEGLKVILGYFGGVQDRVEQIDSIGGDALNVETSMKGYTNDLAEIAQRTGDQTTLFGNIDPINVLEKADEEILREKIIEQINIGREQANGRFVTSTGSPVSPNTSLSRIRKFIQLARSV